MASDGFPTVYDAKKTRSKECGRVFFTEPSRTRPEFKAECDINRIMGRYLRNGTLPVGVGVGQYGDFSTVTDFQEAQFILERANAQFKSLPAKVRDEFENDPGKFLTFVSDPKNLEKAKELGLLKAVEGPQKVEVVNMPAPPAPPKEGK